MSSAQHPAENALSPIRSWLGSRSIVLVGLMGAGKTTIGRRLAVRLGLPFIDSDNAIEEAAGQSIEDFFSEHGETSFRDGERRVIDRLLHEGPQVLATGGGAFMDAATRDNIAARGVSVWLHAEFETLMERVLRRSHRPLLKTADPEATMKQLIQDRYPVYALSDIRVESAEGPHELVVGKIIEALAAAASNQETPHEP
ncbi:MAG: shikimate kinase [Hyphomicrobiales bacterium]|nr:MAG: shikimate kinase [Hyphomicrobiales bacterium]